MPAVNKVNPWSGPSSGRARPASPTRYSSSSPPSRSSTAPTPPTTASAAGSPRTSAADRERHRQARGLTPAVPVGQPRERGRLLEQTLRARPRVPRRAARNTSPTRSPRSPRGRAVRRPCAPAPSRERQRRLVPHVGRIASRAKRRCRASTSDEIQRAVVLDQRPPQVPRHRRVVGPRSRRQSHPRQLERGERDPGPAERRRNSNGAPSASPTARPRMLPIARSRWSVTAGAYPQVTANRGLVA